jgi:guanine deaminase
MQQAIDLAVSSVHDGGGGPFGAVVVKDGEIVGRGRNQVTTLGDPTAHAEVQAIRDACRTLGTHVLVGCELYSSCEPCPMCLAATYWARIGAVFFASDRHDAAAAGFDDEQFYREFEKPVAERALAMEQLMRDESLEAFRAWEAKADREPY